MSEAARLAQLERVQRELARRRLMAFSTYVQPWYQDAAHHRMTADLLEQVELYIRTRGKQGIGRLLIFEPPRHGKSQLAARNFPAWVLGRLPNTQIILASYGADLAVKHSRAVREIVMGPKYRGVFGDLGGGAPVELSDDSRSAQAWDLAAPNRGGLTAAGVGGAITGMGANLFIVDDPFKNREEAESEVRRETVWQWWTSSAYTRLEDGAAIVGMLTRWHADDWAGRLLKAMASEPHADKYAVLNLPACAYEPEMYIKTDEERREQWMTGVWMDEQDPLGREPGQALWPDKYNEDDLESIRSNVGQYDWNSLYQQQPYLRAGGMFQRKNFMVVESLPDPAELVQRIRYWDKAGSEGKGDYTVGVLMTMAVNGTIYVEHVVRGQWATSHRDEEMVKTANQDAQRLGPRTAHWHEQEPGSSGLDSARATNGQMAMAGHEAHFATVTGEKAVRAHPWSAMMEAGKVRLVRGGWNDAYIQEHIQFPSGRHDDQVDASSGAFSKLALMVISGELMV